jgi:hypothetical protein
LWKARKVADGPAEDLPGRVADGLPLPGVAVAADASARGAVEEAKPALVEYALRELKPELFSELMELMS